MPMYDISANIVTPIKNRFDALGIHPSAIGTVIFVLLSLSDDNQEALDAFDEYNEDKRVLFIYKTLHLRGIITPSDGPLLYKLTAIGEELVKEIRSILGLIKKVVEMAETPVEKIEKVTNQVREDDIDIWVNDYIKMWPVMSFEGYSLRTNREAIITKLRAFISKYGFDKDTIFEATRRYLVERRKQNFQYTKKISNFISFTDIKSEGKPVSSDLAAWCERVAEGEEEPREETESNFFYDI